MVSLFEEFLSWLHLSLWKLHLGKQFLAMNGKEDLNSCVIINRNVQRVWGFRGLVLVCFPSSLHALNKFHLPASWGNPSQDWSPVLVTEGIHSLLSSMRWVCQTLAQIPLQLPFFTGATLLSIGLLGQWICHTGSLPGLTARISPSLHSLRGLCSPLGNASKQNSSSLLIRSISGQASAVTMTLVQLHAIQMFPFTLLQHLLLAKGSWEVAMAMPMYIHSPDQHIWWPSSQVNYRGIRHSGRHFLSVWSYLSIWEGWGSCVIRSVCSTVAMRLQSHMPRDLGSGLLPILSHPFKEQSQTIREFKGQLQRT